MIDFGWQKFYVKVEFKLNAKLIEASILVEIRGKCKVVGKSFLPTICNVSEGLFGLTMKLSVFRQSN